MQHLTKFIKRDRSPNEIDRPLQKYPISRRSLTQIVLGWDLGFHSLEQAKSLSQRPRRFANLVSESMMKTPWKKSARRSGFPRTLDSIDPDFDPNFIRDFFQQCSLDCDRLGLGAGLRLQTQKAKDNMQTATGNGQYDRADQGRNKPIHRKPLGAKVGRQHQAKGIND